MILDRRVGDIPVLRRYIGDQLVWEREAPPSPPWAALVNFGLSGKTSDNIAGWNNVKATSGQIAAGATFTGLLDTDGQELPITIELTSATLYERTDVVIGDNAVNQNVYKTNYSFEGGVGGSMTLSGLNDSKFYKVTLIGYAVLDVAPYLVFYTKVVLNGVDLPIQQDHDTDLEFDDSLYYIRAIDVKPINGELVFEFYPTVELPPGYDVVYPLSGLKIEEYSSSTGWEYPIELVPMGDSPIPYVVRVPDVIDESTPVIISLPSGGTEGVGTGSLDHINWIFNETLTKPLLNRNDIVPANALIVCPQFLANDWNQELLSDFIEYLEDEYSIVGNSLYLMGFSAGMEIGLAYIGLAHRAITAAVLMSSAYAGDGVDAPLLSAVAATNTPIWMFCSNNDGLVPLSNFLDIRTQLLASNPDYPLKVTVFNDNTHYRPMMYLYNDKLDVPLPLPTVGGYDSYTRGEHWDWLLSHGVD